MTLFTVIIFFNMNLFLAEVEALRLLEDHNMVENIAKLVAGSATEEEKDIAGSSEEESSLFSEIEIPQIHQYFSIIPGVDANKNQYMHTAAKLLTRSKETVSPPPEA
ncbi:MAG TPA: hypothetical protein VIN08_27265 [Ohtaekwangia sp.]|uniref:hypothetical protein n=1 Tax=Ohtaekwangia sp. TaxID=2066019 RepID=UPI002F92AB9D